MIFVLLVLALAAMVLSPYISVVRKRKKMIKRLTYIARKNGFRVRWSRRFVYLSANLGRKYDLLFECKECAYAVKLWSAVRKNSTLCIRDGRVSESVSLPQVLDAEQCSERRIGMRERAVPITVNPFKLRHIKPVTNVLLYYPPNKNILYFSKNEIKHVCTGDKIFGKLLCSPGRFEEMLIAYGQKHRADADNKVINSKNDSPIKP